MRINERKKTKNKGLDIEQIYGHGSQRGPMPGVSVPAACRQQASALWLWLCKFRSFGIDGIPNECLRHLSRRPLVHLTHLFNHCLRLSHFPKSWKEAKVITLPKPGKDPKFPQNLRPISLLSTTGKLFEKVIHNIVQKHIEERSQLNASQFGFCARHSTTLQCRRLTDHVTLNFNNNMSMAAVFLDIEKIFDTTRHSGLLYKLSKLEYSTSLIKLISSFLSQRKFVSVEGEMSTPREIQQGCLKVLFCPLLCITCI
jgi:hypothetical protein